MASLVVEADVSHWREWVGALEWEALTKTQLMVDTRMMSARAEVMDGDNQQLEASLSRARRALLLVGPVGLVSGETRSLSGEVEGQAPTDRLRSIRGLPRRGETVAGTGGQRPAPDRVGLWSAGQAGNKGKRKRLSDAVRYLTEHRHRMRYDSLRARDLVIGTGAAEGAVRNLVELRLDGPGMRWGRVRAERVLLLRCVLLSGLWDEFAAHVSRAPALKLRASPMPARPYEAAPRKEAA